MEILCLKQAVCIHIENSERYKVHTLGAVNNSPNQTTNPAYGNNGPAWDQIFRPVLVKQFVCLFARDFRALCFGIKKVTRYKIIYTSMILHTFYGNYDEIREKGT